ncbi:MAG: hypothetical protein BWK72_12840 [Rhodoferax ferrireducens]|uniref:Uncharacterized protein n=1 Tax=Rhodoferax ferrireducens TaxID=192843 RepID=A0A1W9KSN7_9BURK|nr:MAG: hypothetical protein BWK72_12840 [Rhodoferax ferrireducens]
MTSCPEFDLAAPLQFVIRAVATDGTQNLELLLPGAQRHLVMLNKRWLNFVKAGIFQPNFLLFQ